MSYAPPLGASIAEYLEIAWRLPAGRPALYVLHDDPSRDYTLDWHEVVELACRWAAALEQLGVGPGDRVGHLSENRWEWIITDLALHVIGAVHVPVHAPLTASQVAYQLQHSGCRLVVASTGEETAKLQQLPATLTRIAYDEGHDLPTMQQLTQAASGDPPAQLAAAVRRSRPEQLATILYTSGTTGEPKGVMLSHGNLASNAYWACTTFGQLPDDRRVTLLPLSHIFARTCDLYCWLVCAAQVAIARRRESVIEDCQRVHPTVLNAVPYFYERLRRALEEHGAPPPGAVRAILGGRIRSCCSGGAALPVHLFDFFAEQGVPILQGYGLTETSPVITASSPSHNRRGAVGLPMPHVQIRADTDGEILTAGPHVMMGYYQRPEDTAEVLQDGWFRTGDLGHIDEDGYLWITGRKKELIVTSGGKNIAPVLLESLITRDPLIEQALVIGDDRSHLTALIVPHAAALAKALQDEEAAGAQRFTGPSSRAQVVQRLLQQRIDAQLGEVSYYEQVRKITVLDRPFTIEAGEMTPKLSLRRGVISQHYAAEIAAMYERDA